MASTVVAAAVRSDVPPRQPVDPSASSSPDVADRSDSFNSSPNHFSDTEIQLQTPDVLKSEEYRQLFRLPLEEVLIEDFNCALQENLLIQGHMYLFVNFICFYSNIFGYETKKIIPFPEVTSVRRAKTAGLFPNAIEILAGNKKYFFASFLSRDEAFRIINEGWSRHGNGAIAIMEQKESMSESSCQENGFVAVENVKSSYITNNGSLSTDLSKDTALPSIVDDPLLTEDSAKQCSVKQVAEPELNIDAPNAASVSWKWNEEDIDAPSILEAYTCVADSVFPIKVEDFFRYLFSDDALNFLESFRQKCGDKDFRCSSWHPQEKFGYARELSFQHPIKIYLGAKFGGCHEVQKFRVYRNSHLVIETSQEVSDVPYADYFRVEGLWSVERDKDESKECCFLRVYVNVAFSKKTIWKGKIIQSTIEECRDAYATWINMAHEMLKQKNLEKQAQNGEINLDREVKTGESSEGSQEQSNHTKILATSNAFDATTHNVGSHLPGNFIEPSSVPLFKEFMTKFRSSLRSHSNLSLLLITVVALIFFIQQCSILVLLARPQHIHMNTPVDITNRMNNEVTRSPSDIAWLEKRIHHLKDEMYMVESRLERMRGGGCRGALRRLPRRATPQSTVEGASSPSIVEIMVRTRGLGCVLGHITDRGVGRGDRDDSDDALQRPQPTASARRQRVAITAEHDEPVVPVTEAVGASVEPVVYADEPMARGDVHDTGADTPADTGTQAVEDEAEGFLGGPSDPSVLTEYADHVAGSVWTGEERPELKLSSHGRKVHSLGRPIPAIKGLVVGTGLSLLIACSIDTGDWGLLSSFVEQ